MDPLPDRSAPVQKASRTWSIYWRDRNLKFHLYDLMEPSERIEDVLDEIDKDPTSIFWG